MLKSPNQCNFWNLSLGYLKTWFHLFSMLKSVKRAIPSCIRLFNNHGQPSYAPFHPMQYHLQKMAFDCKFEIVFYISISVFASLFVLHWSPSMTKTNVLKSINLKVLKDFRRYIYTKKVQFNSVPRAQMCNPNVTIGLCEILWQAN